MSANQLGCTQLHSTFLTHAALPPLFYVIIPSLCTSFYFLIPVGSSSLPVFPPAHLAEVYEWMKTMYVLMFIRFHVCCSSIWSVVPLLIVHCSMSHYTPATSSISISLADPDTRLEGAHQYRHSVIAELDRGPCPDFSPWIRHSLVCLQHLIFPQHFPQHILLSTTFLFTTSYQHRVSFL